MTARRVAGVAAALGGLLWIVKVLQIVGNDGTNTGDGLVGVTYIAGLLVMLVASGAIGWWVTSHLHPVIRALCALIGAVLFFVVFTVLDAVAKAVLGDVGDSYMEDEWGIVLTGAVYLVAGAAILVTAAARVPGEDGARR